MGIPRLGLIAALLALFGQLLAATVIPQPAAGATLADLLGDPGAICHADGTAPSHPGHTGTDCPLCPTCATLTHAVPLPVGAPAIPRPAAVALVRAEPAPIEVLVPPAPRLAAEPRGPPAEV